MKGQDFSEAAGEAPISHPSKDKTKMLCFLLNFPLCLQKGKQWVLTNSGSHG